MITLTEKDNCCGCTACANVCPKHCISMREDDEGFLYPIVNTDLCIKCNKCVNVCPYKQEKLFNENIDAAYIIRAKNTEYLKNGTSGGFVGPLIEYILKNDGVSCAAIMDKDMNVHHSFISDINEWKQIYDKVQGSKYVQSELGDCFEKIKKFLLQEKQVLFIGTPCQVNGLRNYLNGVNLENLLLVDIICHGVPSKLLWNSYKDYQEKQYKATIIDSKFRKKTYGYNGSTMSLVFNDGKQYDGFLRTDIMLKAYYGNLGTRYSCFNCPAKGDRRSSDFTIFDSWHANELVPKSINDNRGYTNVLFRSAKAHTYWESMKDKYLYYEIEPSIAIQMDGVMYSRNTIPHLNREKLYTMLRERDLKDVMKSLMPVTINDKVRVVIKKMLLKGKRWKA